ncbi:MAG TPA: tRNA adenosine deaminase-associated protein [Mycobacteriales bacterium]|nr:tRNA adenosine deaminase-associated protein [Mycobacteriales bacterium]
MSYLATVLARNTNTWTAHEVDLDEAEDIDGVVDVIRSVDESADTTLLFVDEEDEYLAIVRVDGDADARVFVSDGHALDSFALPALLLDGAALDDSSEDDDDDDTPAGHDSDPIGDAELLADLGTPQATLIRLCNAESTLPADVVLSIAERAGFLDEFEAVRA